MSEVNQSRRRFLHYLLGGGVLATLVSFLYPVLCYIKPPMQPVVSVSQLKLPFKREDIAREAKKAKYFKFGRDMGIIILTPQDELVAMSARCTHLDCTVQHRPDLGLIWCSCHNGRYDLKGKNISGPPPRPLTQYAVNEVKGELFVSRT